MKDWDQCRNFEVVRGPVCTRVRRWGFPRSPIHPVISPTENLHDYLIPTIGDVPPIEVILIEDPEPLGPFGAKGVGEPGLVPTAPAILGAIRHATGARLTRVPALPHRVRAAIRELEASDD